MTAESDQFARQLFEQDRTLFAYYQTNGVSTLGQQALDDFLSTPRAVRWWHVSQTYGSDGIALAGDACSFVKGGGGCVSRSGAPYAPQVSAVAW